VGKSEKVNCKFADVGTLNNCIPPNYTVGCPQHDFFEREVENIVLILFLATAKVTNFWRVSGSETIGPSAVRRGMLGNRSHNENKNTLRLHMKGIISRKSDDLASEVINSNLKQPGLKFKKHFYHFKSISQKLPRLAPPLH